jgi:hypothetical protein
MNEADFPAGLCQRQTKRHQNIPLAEGQRDIFFFFSL